MIFLEYEKFKQKYFDAQKKFDEILQEKEELFTKTQPQSPNWDKIGQPSNQVVSKFDNYVCAKESYKIDERLREIKTILADRKKLLELKSKELDESNEKVDKFYKMRFIELLTMKQISRKLNYEKSQTYRLRSEVIKILNSIKPCIKWD